MGYQDYKIGITCRIPSLQDWCQTCDPKLQLVSDVGYQDYKTGVTRRIPSLQDWCQTWDTKITKLVSDVGYQDFKLVSDVEYQRLIYKSGVGCGITKIGFTVKIITLASDMEFKVYKTDVDVMIIFISVSKVTSPN